MNIIISHYLGDTYDYSIQQIEQTCILRIDIESMTGKNHKIYILTLIR